MKTRFLVSPKDIVYIEGVETVVRKNGWAGKHQWVCNQRKGVLDEICQRLAQQLMDIGEATFYRRETNKPNSKE